MNSKKFFSRRNSRLILLLFLCCVIAFLWPVHLFRSRQREFRFLTDDTVTEYLVDTPGCLIPSRDPFDATVKSFYQPITGPYACRKKPSILTVKPNGVVSLDKTILELYYGKQQDSVYCTYEAIVRAGNIENFTADDTWKITSKKMLPLDTNLRQDFIRTECKFIDDEETDTFIDYLALTPLKPDVEQRCNSKMDISKRQLNVVFVGIDSISRLNFLRHFTKTRKYLNDELLSFPLEGYTKVGDNTFPNLMPLLTGQFYEYYWNETTNKTMYFDDVDFLWKEFSKRGYRTLLAEDAPRIATFNYFRSGFKHPPTDYYYRPLALALEYSQFKEDSRSHCFGEHMEIEVIYNYLKSFVSTMNHSRPFFAFTFVARLTHDVLNYAGYADEPTFQLLRYLNSYEYLNNTALVLYSDHGIRFSDILNTYIGQLEVRMPFAYLVLPRTFEKTHKKLVKNLRINRNRLTTPFDFHETMLDLLDVDNIKPEDMPVLAHSGISLFNEISPYRTCDHANISTHWCTCHEQKEVPIGDKLVSKAAEVVVSTLNRWTEHLRNKCAVLILDRILDARSITKRTVLQNTSNQTQISPKKDKNDSYVELLLVISTKPSGGYFDSTVRCKDNGNCEVIDDVGRINKYGTQSICIEDTVLKKFCYCR